MKAIQLALFADAQTDTEHEASLHWSYSRRQTLEQCARRYYYEYYGAKRHSAITDPRKNDIRFLSTLSNRYLRTGEILHIAIRLFYKHGDSSSNWLVDWAQRTYRADYEFSQKPKSERQSAEQYPPVLLLEFYYGQPDAQAMFAESEERLMTTIRSFLYSSLYADIRYQGQRPSARVEEWIAVKTPTFAARGRIDIAFAQGDRLVIVDWKTGEVDRLAESLQIAFYALWAVKTEGYDKNSIDLYYGQLMDGSLQPVVFGGRTLSRAEARINQDLERMGMLDHYGQEAVLRVFPSCNMPKVCKLCPYQGICSGIA